ncbi:hypothetical protein [Nonomuraea aridisoli]|uniref:Uncharacterized protein n=1 Tax=Nonomuraea aridisoli TaxID=2070368 RepID=A0A2W2ENY5_9ACTN|nr:hypothetical protein [Nonomuraea aridisoli]PZG18469.1 hypothetical protein C1J01_15125 [Nonomuraea aridisoli]
MSWPNATKAAPSPGTSWPGDHQFLGLASRHAGGGVMPVTYGGDQGAMMRRDAEHAVRRHPLHEYEIAKYHPGLLDLHAVEEGMIYRYDHEGGGRELVAFVTCAYCDNGNPYEATHRGYPVPHHPRPPPRPP